ncbi:unnamed protein product [Rotaria sp. Silwood1]|nr:unnamed protein product [Rotaria sp. Silwood1]
MHYFKLSLLNATGYSSFELNREEWNILESIEEVLNGFSETTTLISGQKYCIIGIGFVAITNLKETLEERTGNAQVDRLKDLLLAQLKNCIDDHFDQYELVKRRAYYDPLGFGSMGRADRVSIEREIKTLYNESISSSSTTNSHMVNTSSATTVEHQSKPNPIQRFLSSIGKRPTRINKSDIVLSITNELALYRSLAMQEYTGEIYVTYRSCESFALVSVSDSDCSSEFSFFCLNGMER